MTASLTYLGWTEFSLGYYPGVLCFELKQIAFKTEVLRLLVISPYHSLTGGITLLDDPRNIQRGSMSLMGSLNAILVNAIIIFIFSIITFGAPLVSYLSLTGRLRVY